MSNRACPLCFARLSRTQVLSRSNHLICPACHAQLELSRPSRLLASFAGVFRSNIDISTRAFFQLPDQLDLADAGRHSFLWLCFCLSTFAGI